MFGFGREKNPPMRSNLLMSLPFLLLLIVSLMIPFGTFAETGPAKSTFSLEVKDKLINLQLIREFDME